MKTVKFLSVSLLLVVFVMGSCSKYEEGPLLSLRTKKARLAGVWKVEKTISNDGETNYPSSDDNGTIEYTKDNVVKTTFEFFGLEVVISGEWEFIKDKEWLRTSIEINGEQEVEESKIIKLKNDELWVEDVNGNQTHFVPA